MAVRRVICFPDPRLTQPSESVGEITDEIRALAADLVDTLHAERCSGLSAAQIGAPARILAICAAAVGQDGPLIAINPHVVAASREQVTISEGCVSAPGVYREIERPAEVTVAYLDLHGEARALQASGRLAACLHHQIDHLNGLIFSPAEMVETT